MIQRSGATPEDAVQFDDGKIRGTRQSLCQSRFPGTTPAWYDDAVHAAPSLSECCERGFHRLRTQLFVRRVRKLQAAVLKTAERDDGASGLCERRLLAEDQLA